MNLNNKLNEIEGNKKLVIGIIIGVLLLACVLIFITTRNSSIEEPPITTPVQDEPLVEEVPPIDDIEEVPQDETVGVWKANVVSVRDLSTKIEYIVNIGVGDSAKETMVTANSETVYFDFATNKIIMPNSLTENMNVVLYAKGNYNAGNLVANVIGVGENTSYRYAEISSMEIQNDGSSIWNLRNLPDRLKITADCDIIDGNTGSDIQDLVLIKENSKILYKYEPDFEITDSGNLYYCTEVLVMGVLDE